MQGLPRLRGGACRRPQRYTARLGVALGSVRLRVTGETQPCGIMDRQRAGVRRALEPDWRGGATCTVVAGGTSRSDTVELVRGG